MRTSLVQATVTIQMHTHGPVSIRVTPRLQLLLFMRRLLKLQRLLTWRLRCRTISSRCLLVRSSGLLSCLASKTLPLLQQSVVLARQGIVVHHLLLAHIVCISGRLDCMLLILVRTCPLIRQPTQFGCQCRRRCTSRSILSLGKAAGTSRRSVSGRCWRRRCHL